MATLDELRATALQKLNDALQPNTEPRLTSQEVERLLDECQRAGIWAAETEYAYGAVIQPTAGNGRRYKATQSGTSGAAEPTWSVGRESQHTDGADASPLTWTEDGPAYLGLWDVASAASEGWMMKAGKASVAVNLKQQIGGIDASQVYDHCVKQAQLYAPIRVA